MTNPSELIEYDPETGLFRWSETLAGDRRRRVGWFPGKADTRGYLQVRVNGRLWLAHRLAWLLMTGSPPSKQIDHVNRIKTDNRWSNLRPATHAENQRNRGLQSNNSTGYCGVYRRTLKGGGERFEAYIKVAGTVRHLGCFSTADAAYAARCDAARQYHGEFAPTVTSDRTTDQRHPNQIMPAPRSAPVGSRP